jgi:hypothetical protein
MSIAGYAMFSEEEKGGAGGNNYYLLHNSWGSKWGDGGYAWIHEATIAKHMHGSFGVIDARPLNGIVAQSHGVTCADPQVPDSILATCVEPCPDMSPPHAGVCPEPADCPAGFVNLTGSCVLAAPSRSGALPNGVRWTCGAGGCVYTLPKAIAGCEGETCLVSCPAPAFRVASTAAGLSCVE